MWSHPLNPTQFERAWAALYKRTYDKVENIYRPMKWFSMHKIINDLFTILSISKIIFLLILI